MKLTRECCGAVALLALLAAAPADAAQVIAPRDVSASLAVGADGRAFVVSPTARADVHPLRHVRRRTAAPGGAFGPSRMLLPGRAVDAGVSADGSGVIVVQRERSVRAVAFDARGRRGRPQTLAGPVADFAASAVAPSGAAVVVWFRHLRGRWRLEAATRAPGATRFGAAQPVSAYVRRACCTHVSVAVGARGDAAVTWTSTSRPAVWAALRPLGGRFGPARRLAVEAASDPTVVVGAGGTVALLYSTQHVPLRPTDGLQLRRAMTTGGFGPAEHVNPGAGVTSAAAGVTATGRVLVAWRARPDEVVHLSEAAPNAPLAVAAELGRAVASDRLALDADDTGRVVVAWSERAPGGRRARAALRPAAAAPFATPVALGRPWPTAEPGPARLVPGGGALVAWNGATPRRRAALLVTRLA